MIPVISIERFRARLAAGRSQGYPYASSRKTGFISVWRHEDAIFLTWEECTFGESATRNERREFASADEAIDWLESQGVDPARFGP